MVDQLEQLVKVIPAVASDGVSEASRAAGRAQALDPPRKDGIRFGRWLHAALDRSHLD